MVGSWCWLGWRESRLTKPGLSIPGTGKGMLPGLSPLLTTAQLCWSCHRALGAEHKPELATAGVERALDMYLSILCVRGYLGVRRRPLTKQGPGARQSVCSGALMPSPTFCWCPRPRGFLRLPDPGTVLCWRVRFSSFRATLVLLGNLSSCFIFQKCTLGSGAVGISPVPPGGSLARLCGILIPAALPKGLFSMLTLRSLSGGLSHCLAQVPSDK